ncbi:hypothetical protein PC114_g4618 [Phytophthora cactorum]|nr:hypothetical protein PC114_g4618 [Phytophthora cactorum]KAG3089342.1 hypothetical protein PC122_g7937 [Phytophthora cactorum]KAG3186185.1 hypothetical protein C6341_g4014 [Phytophthora cactorum]
MACGSSVPRAGEKDVVKKSGKMIKRGVYAALCVSGCCGSAAGLVHVREVTGQGLQNGREGREQLGSEESALLSAINQSNSTTSRSLTSTNPGHQRRYKIPR